MRRIEAGVRHPIHRDVINAPDLAGVEATVRDVVPLGLGAGLVRVDTDADDALDRAVRDVRSALAVR